MRFSDFLPEECIRVGLRARDGRDVLHELAGMLAAKTHTSGEQLESLLMAREHLSSTGVGEGVAFPHCRFDELRHLLTGIAVVPEGVDFGARDGAPVHLFVAIVSPTNAPGTHLRLIARIAALLQDVDLRHALLEAPSAAAVRSLVERAEENYLLGQRARQDIHVPA